MQIWGFELYEGGLVLLKVSPFKCVMRFGKNDKLSPIFIGPVKILIQIRKVAYKLALQPSLAVVHLVFHVSMILKYVLSLNLAVFSQDISFEEELIAKFDRQV